MIWIVALSLVVWLGLLVAHGRFWRADQRLPAGTPASKAPLPTVVAVVPARDEAEVIALSVGSLLRQDYAGPFHVVVVDDHSSDGTAEVTLRTAAAIGAADRLTVIAAAPLPDGWAGKMWAVSQGIAKAADLYPEADYLLLTDADIEHGRDGLARLVTKAEADELDLASLMVLLNCRSLAEQLLVPAFVFFFQKLYPFPRVNDSRSAVAGAAGGCMLVRRTALEAAGGIAAIRNAIIDDCALARLLKARGRIWLGLTQTTRSIRPYPAFGDFWNMVARTAYTQLRYSPLLLLGTVLGMVLLYLVPPAAFFGGAISGDRAVSAIGGIAWLAMCVAYWPTVKLYGQPRQRTLSLPLAGALYTLMTIASAWRHWRGRGAGWKGRTYAGAAP